MDQPAKPSVVRPLFNPEYSTKEPTRKPHSRGIRGRVIALSLLVIIPGGLACGVMWQRVRNMEAWSAEQKVIQSARYRGPNVQFVTEPVIAKWLCVHPDHVNRVVEIHFPQEHDFESNLYRESGTWANNGRGFYQGELGAKMLPMTEAEIKLAPRKFPYLREISAGRKTLFSRVQK